MSHLSEEQLDQIIAAERWREQEPLNDWRTIAARARAEGLIRDIDAVAGRSSSQAWLQAAAAILILIGGIAIGHTSIGLPSGSESVAAGAQTRARQPRHLLRLPPRRQSPLPAMRALPRSTMRRRLWIAR